MRAVRSHPEVHLSQRSNWLRAAVLGANDGILSTASLVLGVAASGASGAAIVTAGIAGLVAGALSMAAGEYVSVSSQRDTERADIRLEERELRPRPGRRAARARRDLRAAGPGRRRSRARWRWPCRAGARWRRTPATSWASTSSGWRGRFRRRGRRRCRSRRGAALPLLAVAAAPAAARVAVAVVVTLIALGLLGDLGARLGRRAARSRGGPGRRLGRGRDGDHVGYRRARRRRLLDSHADSRRRLTHTGTPSPSGPGGTVVRLAAARHFADGSVDGSDRDRDGRRRQGRRAGGCRGRSLVSSAAGHHRIRWHRRRSRRGLLPRRRRHPLGVPCRTRARDPSPAATGAQPATSTAASTGSACVTPAPWRTTFRAPVVPASAKVS